MDHDHRTTRTSSLRAAADPGRTGCAHHRVAVRRRTVDTAERCADVWDVGSWDAEPRQGFRLNTLFDRTDGAVVTVSGHLEGSDADAQLAAVVRPFERLGCAIVVDVCHAVLGHEAVLVLVRVGLRHSAGPDGHAFTIAHPDAGCRQRVEAAGGRRLLRAPCAACAAGRLD